MAVVEVENIVQPKIDFETGENGEYVVYNAEVRSLYRGLLSTIIGVPAVFAALSGLVLFPMSFLTDTPLYLRLMLFFGTLLCIAITAGAHIWGRKPKKIPIKIDARSISVSGKTYLLEHVKSVGYREFGKPGNGIGQIFIQYGGEEIMIVSGMDLLRTEFVYSDIQSFLKRFGHDYTH